MNIASMCAYAARNGARSACRLKSSVNSPAHSATIPMSAQPERGRRLSMARIKLGVSLKSLPWPLRRSLQEAQRAGAAGVELAAQGDLAPQNLSQTGRRELRHLLRSYDLQVAAVFCPLRRGLDTPENLQPRLDSIRQTMTLAFDLCLRMVV